MVTQGTISPSEVRVVSQRNGTPFELETKGPPLSFAGVDASTLEEYVNAPIDWLVEWVLSADQPSIFGAGSKCCKTLQLIDLSVALATGTKWLDLFNVPKQRKTLFITGEASNRAVAKKLERALKVRGLNWNDLKGNLRIEASLFPKFPNVEHLDAMERTVAEHGFEVAIVDPIYRGLSTVDMKQLAEAGAALADFAAACKPASTIYSHHFTKAAVTTGQQPTLENLSGAGLAEFAGNWWLIGRNTPYQADRMHDMTILYGGREEQCGLKRLIINEADWKFELSDVETLQADKQAEKRKQAEQKQKDTFRIIESAIKNKLANSEDPKSKKWLEERVTGKTTEIRSVIAQMEDCGTLIRERYKAGNGQNYDGYILKKNAKKGSDSE